MEKLYPDLYRIFYIYHTQKEFMAITAIIVLRIIYLLIMLKYLQKYKMGNQNEDERWLKGSNLIDNDFLVMVYKRFILFKFISINIQKVQANCHISG
jgi:hypothetical protein